MRVSGSEGMEIQNGEVATSVTKLSIPMEGAAPPETSRSERPSQVMQALHGLDSLMAAHDSWLRQFHIDLIAGLSDTERAQSPVARPDVGAWTHTLLHASLAEHPSSAEAVDRLRSMLSEADHLVEETDRSRTVPANAYDRFMTSVLGFTSKVRELQNDTWKRLAHVDPLTDLGNRQAMWRRLHVECERHGRTRQPCCLVMIDLDGFKPVNDTYGHAAGDVVLASVAAVLSASVRPYDTVFRYGGDEFLMCLPNTDLRAAWAIVERLRLKIANHRIALRPGAEARTTLSVGVASLSTADGVKASMDRADEALYVAKRCGGNCVYVMSDDEPRRACAP